MTDIAPIRRYVEVRASIETAFALFTSHIASWWPMRRHSVFGADARVRFEGDRLVERHGDQQSVWAEVVEWDPPRSLRLAWHPGHDQGHATDVQITFASDEGVTVVTLVHSGWEAVDDPAATADSYGQGWPIVLGEYARRVNSDDADDIDDAEGPGDESYALPQPPGASTRRG
jgi:uncharacterized protein YndB with AHSA1/START domain